MHLLASIDISQSANKPDIVLKQLTLIPVTICESYGRFSFYGLTDRKTS